MYFRAAALVRPGRPVIERSTEASVGTAFARVVAAALAGGLLKPTVLSWLPEPGEPTTALALELAPDFREEDLSAIHRSMPKRFTLAAGCLLRR